MDLGKHGLTNLGPVHAQLAPALLIELALARREGELASNGAFVANTVPFTGRAAKDKYIVRRPGR
jgi:phosphoenolpyruvate carboxykinase (ATP)